MRALWMAVWLSLMASGCTSYPVIVEEIDVTKSATSTPAHTPKKITGKPPADSNLTTEHVALNRQVNVSLAKAPVPAPKPIAPAHANKWQWPTLAQNQFKRVSTEEQNGLDIFGKLGDPVYAVNPGRVMYAGDGLKNYGNLVIVRHSENWVSVYAHLQKILVKEGDQVNAGQRIALLGNSGSTPEMKLYFEIRQKGKPVDPYLKIKPPQK